MRTTGLFARVFALGLLVAATWTGLHAQTTLEDMVDQGNASWMLGKWQGSTDDATAVTIEFSWDLNKHVILMHGKVGYDMEFKGYSALEPGTSEVKYTGYDNRGVLSRGTWDLEAGELTLRLESKSTDRNTKMAAVFTGSPSQGLEVRLHGVNEYGSISYPARTTLKLKKQ